MNFDSIKNIIEKADSGAFDKTAERRDILKSAGAKILAVSVPFIASSFFNKANAQTTNHIVNALNRLLKIERLLYAFYKAGNETEGLIPKALEDTFNKIENDDFLHVAHLSNLIDSLSGSIDPEPAGYDFTGKGMFPEVLVKYADFLSVAQVLKDTSIRAYKGMLATFMPQDAIISDIINIHSIEAKHSAYIRLQRKGYGVKQWITGNNTGITQPGAVPTYTNEENTTQAGIQITNINGFIVPANTASEAFDEPFIIEESMPIFDKFII
jgi:hypothetical protein